MNETDKYILDAIKKKVWSGFYDASGIHQLIDDILEVNADEKMLRAAVGLEFKEKAAAEQSWPIETDCDRLDRAFETLNAQGIIAVHHAGYTMSDGITEVSEELQQRGCEGIKGYCFYHGQDLEHALNGRGLMLAFGDLNDDKSANAEIGSIVQAVVESHGLTTQWNGDSETRVAIPNIDWKRRGAG